MVLIRLLMYDQTIDVIGEKSPQFRWKAILNRLLDGRSPSRKKVANLLEEIEGISVEGYEQRMGLLGCNPPSQWSVAQS